MLLDLLFHHLKKDKKVQPQPSVSGSKLHIAELFKEEIVKEDKFKYIKQDDEDILALLGFMVSNRLIT
jgi:hypothetical protein